MALLAILPFPSPKANMETYLAAIIVLTPILMAFLGTLAIDPKSLAAATLVVLAR